ncbi:MAG: InlB B-repeat-containing protein [Clostridia bacterium]|nr:InlB B-repeat-containing protein [Clostridia bacterium]
MENTNKKKLNFGWKEVLLALVLAVLVVVFVIVFAGNKTTVNFVSVGGHFDEGEGATVYPYENYIVGSDNASMKYYHQILTKTFRISAAASLPDVTRDGYDFLGWYLAEVDENGNITYTETEFTEKSVKELEKDGSITVYAKWKPTEANKDVSMKESVLAALDITWKGMLGIFIVVGLIYVCIVLLNTLTTDKGKMLKSKIFKKKAKKANTAEEATEN